MNDKPRLIDADKLRAKISELEKLARDRVINTDTNSPFYERYSAQLAERENLILKIDLEPAIDAVPVVRCGECKYCENNGGYCQIGDGGTWFCADGKRKEENHD